MSDPLEKHGGASSTDSPGTSGLQLHFGLLGSPITLCQLLTSAERWYVELPTAVTSFWGLSHISLPLFICTASYRFLTGLLNGRQAASYGVTCSRSLDVRRCPRCGGIVVQASMSQSTLPRQSVSSLLSEVTS